MSEGSPPGDRAPQKQRTTAEIAKRRGFRLRGRSVRQHVARGVLINGAFMVGINTLSFVKGFVVAAFLTREDYGIWGIITISLIALLWLKQVGVGDKYIQQDEDDQEVAFQKALGVECLYTGIFMVIFAAALPLIAMAYGEDRLLGPGLVIMLTLPAGILQMPIWTYGRRMEFLRARLLQGVDPLVSFVVSVALAVLGMGYWALIIGVVAGAWAAGLAGVLASPYRLRPRWDSRAVRSYSRFAWPLLVSSFATVVIAQAALFGTNETLGLAAAGAFTLAATITQFTERLDALVTGTLYPAVAAMRENAALMFESFVKSNRLALMWAMPFGFGLSLFCRDLVDFGIGHEWDSAVPVLQMFGFLAAVNHLGFNWSAYFRAANWTKPLAAAGVASMITFLALLYPLLTEHGLSGLAIAIGAQGLVHLAVRVYYLKRLFASFAFLKHAARAMAPTVPAVAVVLLARLFESGERTGTIAAAEFVAYVIVTIVATIAFERRLLREVAGYLRRPPAVGAPA